MQTVPLVLMTGFGYDPKHSIVNSRKAGLPAWAILFKPFRLDQLLGAVEHYVQEPQAAAGSGEKPQTPNPKSETNTKSE